MTYKYWNGAAWIRCSREEAARRRANGQRVMERAPIAPSPVKRRSLVTDHMQGVDCDLCEDGIPHEHGRPDGRPVETKLVDPQPLQSESPFDTSDVDANESTELAAEAEKLGVLQSMRSMRIEFKNSSNLRAAAFDGATRVVTVEFVKGDAYSYANFSEDLMLEWQDAKSPGGWFHANVRSKPDRHPVVKAPEPSASGT